MDISNTTAISAIRDYIVELTGAYNYQLNQWFDFGNNQYGIVIKAEVNRAYLLFDGDINQLKIGQSPNPLTEPLVIPTLMSNFGTISNLYNQKLHGESTFSDEEVISQTSSLFAIAKSMEHRKNLNTPLATGIFAIDVFFPIGLGQRQLIIGDQQTGKSSLCLTTIINNKNQKNLLTIYVSIGNKLNTIKQLYQDLLAHDALDHVMILHAFTNNAFQQYLLPYVAMNHAENLCAAGYDVLIIFDNLTTHANIIREIALLTNSIVGKEAYPGTLFYAHSSLLERAGKFLNDKTITCLPIVNTVNDDITGLLASNIISITDGQIILGSQLKNQGIWPAIDLQKSVSRLGSIVQYQGLKTTKTKMTKIYHEFQTLNQFLNVNFELNLQMQTLMDQGKLLLKIIQQPEYHTYQWEFYVLLALIIENKMINVNDADAKHQLLFLQHYLSYDYLGQKLHQQIHQQLFNHQTLDWPTIQNVLLGALDIYQALVKVQDANQLAYNSQKFGINKVNAHKIAGLLWAK